MAYLGRQGVTAPLTSADIPDNSITSAKIVAGTIEASDVAADMATQAELDLKAPLASPPFTGTPTGITAAHITSGVLPVGVTGGSGLTALGTVLSGTMNNTAGELFKHKIYYHTHTTDFTDGGNQVFAFGTSLAIPSSGNPDGSKFLIIVGGGRLSTGNSAISSRASARIKEASDFGSPGTYEGYSSYGSGTTTDGDTRLINLIIPSIRGLDGNVPMCTSFLLYSNNTGGATNLYIRTALDCYDQAGQNPNWYFGGDFTNSDSDGAAGIIAIKVS